MKLQPLGDRVIVKQLKQEEVTASGIVLPDTVDKEKKAEGEVIALGNGEKLAKLNLKVSDVVLFGKYSGDDVEYEDVDYKILNHDDVLAVVTK